MSVASQLSWQSIAPVITGSNPVEVLNFFQASLRNCINCVHCDDHFFIFISFPQFLYDLFHISLTMTQLPIILNSPQSFIRTNPSLIPQFYLFYIVGGEFLLNHIKRPEDGRCYFQVTAEGQPIKIQRTVFTECFYTLAMAELARASNLPKYRV